MYGLTIQSDFCFQIVSRRWFRVYVWRLIPTQFLPLFSSNTWHHVTPYFSTKLLPWDKLECDKVLTNSQPYCLNCHNRQIRLCQHDCKQQQIIVPAKGIEYSTTCAVGVQDYGILYDTACGPFLQTASCSTKHHTFRLNDILHQSDLIHSKM